MCPTRRTVQANSLKSVLDNYEVLRGIWDEAQSGNLDSEIRARRSSVDAQMNTSDFLFCISLGHIFLGHADNLSKTLQLKSISVAEGQRLAKLTLEVLQSVCDEAQFKNFFARVLQDQVKLSWTSSSQGKEKTP